MTIDPSKNMDIDAILEDLYRSEINASISWASPGRAFHATLGGAALVGPIPGRQLRLLRCTQDGSIRQVQAAECIRSMTEDRAHELEKAMKFD